MTARIITPTSANIASHIFAIPSAPNTKQMNLTANAKTIFCFTILNVLVEIFIAREIFNGSSSIKTTSAASMAASLPRPPIAIPISARESTGASLIPSPTKASFSLTDFLANNFSTSSTLSAGRSSLCTVSMPIVLATRSAVEALSPVNITVSLAPNDFKPLIASLA